MNIAVAQSGGPTCAINASLLGVYKQALKSPEINTVFGSLNGIEGIINDKLVDLKDVLKSENDMEILKLTPSTALGSCRYKLPEPGDNEEVYDIILDCFKRHDIGAFFYIGGNDSMDTVAKLSAFFKTKGTDIRVIGIPKTIDNDLPETDHTPGFGSAAKYVAVTMQEIIRDSSVYSAKSVTIVEIMGRHAGWLTASTCVLRANNETAPHLIYLPECEFSPEKFIDDVKKVQAEHKAVVVAISEGVEIPDADGSYQSGAVDVFGHKYLSGIGKLLENLVRDKIGCKVRSIELNVMQRCSSHINSKTDIDEAELIGAEGVKSALNGKSGETMVFKRVSDNPYTIAVDSADSTLIANHEKFFPKEWVNDEENNVLPQAIDYFLPLIQGEIPIPMKNGMPVHFKI